MTTSSNIAGFPFFEIEFDALGLPVSATQTESLIAWCRQIGATDLFFLAHGFRCDAADATDLYTGLLTTLAANLARPEFATSAGMKLAIIGVYWPSQPHRESYGGTTQPVDTAFAELRSAMPAGALDDAERLLYPAANNRSARDQFVESVLRAVDTGHDDPAEGLPLLHECSGSDLLERLSPPAIDFGGRIDAIPVIAPILGGIGTFLNFMSWAAMKRLAGAVGTNGLAETVIACQDQLNKTRIHLVGHSLGGRLQAACCKALAAADRPPVDSLSLLEAAFSHYGFSPDAGSGQPGFFRDVVERRIVRGPIISTFSKKDSVVGTAYAVASRLAHDNLQAIGDASDTYGGIGHNGAQRTSESTFTPLHEAGLPYQLQPGIVTCLDGSSGLISGHGDIVNPHVTYAISEAITWNARHKPD